MTITNFDLIHHQCRGDKLTHNRKYYKTLFTKKVDLELNNQLHKDVFLSSAQRCERKDVYFEKKKLQKEHFNRTFVKEELKKKGIFLSLMQKQKKCTDECKSLSF